jgi:hypothetical protein
MKEGLIVGREGRELRADACRFTDDHVEPNVTLLREESLGDNQQAHCNNCRTRMLPRDVHSSRYSVL